MTFIIKVLILMIFLNSAALGKCGGEFTQFLSDIKEESLGIGYTEQTVNEFFDNVSLSSEVLKADRAQGIFLKPFNEFAPRLISDYRIQHGKKKFKKIFFYLRQN
tara:strand:- start:434 stop:748 length:315 start_codon:yes stop_codon:yes gene_type:complete